MWDVCFHSLLGSKPHLAMGYVLYLHIHLKGPQLSDTHTHTNNISDTKAFLERPTNSNVTSPWSCGGSWVPSDVRIGAIDGVGGKESHVFISFHEQMMATKMWINHALPGHWLGRITILLLTVQISGEPLDVENLRIYYSRYFRIFISLNWLVLSHGISISIIDMHPGSGRRFHIWPPLALALPATLSFKAPLMETTFLSHVSGHIAKPATPQVPSALDILL